MNEMNDLIRHIYKEKYHYRINDDFLQWIYHQPL